MISYLIVCPLVFLANFIDSIAGGGGLISLPAFLIAGAPPHMALGANRLSFTLGTTVSTIRYGKNGFIHGKIAITASVAMLIDSPIGANLSLLVSESVIKNMMIMILPIMAYCVFRNKNVGAGERIDTLPENQVLVIAIMAAFVVGMYNGFYGPGMGTFLILILTGVVKMNIQKAPGLTKVINLSSNIAALITFIINGKVMYPLGFAAAVFCIGDHYIGSGTVVNNGQKIVHPIVLAVLTILFIKIITGQWAGKEYGMKWNKFTLTTTTKVVDLISNLFGEIGIEGIEIEGNIPLTEAETRGMFIDILPELPPNEGVAKVSLYLEDLSDLEWILKEIEEGLDDLGQFADVGERTIEASETKNKDWINNWKQYFKPSTVGDILIKPTWEKMPKEHEDKLLIQIDPGAAFGTGQHEITQLCIRQFRKYLTPDSEILDVGTGSGILGTTALKLGTKEVFGTDLDESTIMAVGGNLEANQVGDEKFRVLQGNIIDDKAVQDQVGYECYDIVVANILADVIILLQEEIPVHLKKGGIFITFGIINVKEEAVKEAMNQNEALEIIETTYQGEWVFITVRKR